MQVFRILLLLWTLGMLGLHLASRAVLRRALDPAGSPPAWLRFANIIRFEGAYYAALLGYVWLERARFLLTPLILLAAIHILGWIYAEAEGKALLASAVVLGAARTNRILTGIQIFDLAEALVLFYIAWKLILPFL